MKPLLSLFTCCLLTSIMQPFNVSAVDSATQIWIPPRYTDFDPLGNDSLILHVSGGTQLSVQIIQHSPERDNLLLYEHTIDSNADADYHFKMEAGQYTIRFSAPVTAWGYSPQTIELPITLENPDFAPINAPFSQTELRIDAVLQSKTGNESIQPVIDSLPITIQQECKVQPYQVTFAHYMRLRGDYDGSGKIDVGDALGVMQAYADRLALKKPDCSKEQEAVCDINCDTVLDISDALYILQYYADYLALKQPTWDSILQH